MYLYNLGLLSKTLTPLTKAFPPSLCFHFLTLAANVALLTRVGLPEALAFLIHSSVTLPPQ